MAATAANDDSAWGATRAPSVEQFNGSQQIGKLEVNSPTRATAPSTPAVQRDSITIDRLLDDPVTDLIAAANVKLIDSDIDDEFFGAVIIRPGKRTVLFMPQGRSELETDVLTRYLLAQALHLDVTPLPKPFNVEVHPLLPGVPA